MKWIVLFLALLMSGCEQTMPKRIIDSNNDQFKIIKIKKDTILEVQMVSIQKEWPNIKSCDDYEVLGIQCIETYSTRYMPARTWTSIYLKPKKSFQIDWKFAPKYNTQFKSDNVGWFYCHIEVE